MKVSKVTFALTMVVLSISCTVQGRALLLQGGPAKCAPAPPTKLPSCSFNCNGKEWKLECESGGDSWISCKAAEDFPDAKGVYVACKVLAVNQVGRQI